MSNRLLRMKELQEKLAVSRAHLYSLIGRDLFPKPIKLTEGGRASFWIEKEIDQYIQEQAAKR